MRDIKFRCWDNISNRMFESRSLNELMNEAWDIGHADGYDRNEDEYSHLDWMQYTGLKDKNGREIYEGDIVRVESGKLMVVGWNERFASFILNREGWMYSHWFGESCDPEKCEVIGNIYENPELL